MNTLPCPARPAVVRRIQLGMIMVSLMMSAAAAATAADPSFPLQAKRILFLGDSITHAGHYVADIETQLRLQGADPMPELINIGLPSETCTGLSEPDHPFPRPDVHERLDRALQKVGPDVVVACYGMNDGIYYPFSEERFQAYQAGIQKLIDKVHASGARLVLVTPPPFDPVPLRQQEGKLLPANADRYAWFAIYENYDDVMKRYAAWIMQQADAVEMVVDVHTPLNEFLADRRKQNPSFHVAADGVHMNAAGHEILASAILNAWGVESWEEPSAELRSLVSKKHSLLHNAWLSHVGHQRPGVKDGLPLQQAQTQAAELDRKIASLVTEARKPQSSQRPSSGGTVHQIHFPAGVQDGELRLFVDYYLWIPADVRHLRGIIVHQHGCGPGASIGGQTAADDLHWQALAAKQQCALMGSSYEPRRGVNCRLWCDARNGSARRFLQAVDRFAADTGHTELKTVPWCLWGHSGGGFWASLMQTMYPERIVAIWLQSGTAYGYWKKGEIPAPDMSAAVYGVPVMGNPGLKEKDDQRFHVAYDGTKAMRDDYVDSGAAFFEFAPDPRTAHECGDSRYLSIPFFDFWLTHRLSPEGDTDLKPVDQTMLAAWTTKMAPKQQEFIRTGAVSDATPPPAPFNVHAVRLDNGSVQLTWNATADFESGVRGFVIERDGQSIGQVPDRPKGRFGRPLFQSMSYHDTPEQPLPQMQFVDSEAPAGRLPPYSVRTVNSVELKSPPTQANP
ncbi:MAG: SGNH/GDSL hydrolase family protein [Fuerstiella sp.]